MSECALYIVGCPCTHSRAPGPATLAAGSASSASAAWESAVSELAAGVFGKCNLEHLRALFFGIAL
jgi:hypothetical protein